MWALDDDPIRFAYRAQTAPISAALDAQRRLLLIYELESWLETQIGPRYRHWAWATPRATQAEQFGLTFYREQDSCLFTLRWG